MKPDETSMARLASMAQEGDRDAYRTLLIECQRWLKAYYGRKVAPSFIEDLVQETLMALHSKIATFDPTRPFLPWLAAIARYRWVDHLRWAYRRNDTELDDNLADFDGEPAMTARISLERLLAFLPPAQAQAIEMVKITGLTTTQAASASGQSEALIKVNIHRGLKKLATMIEKA